MPHRNRATSVRSYDELASRNKRVKKHILLSLQRRRVIADRHKMLVKQFFSYYHCFQEEIVLDDTNLDQFNRLDTFHLDKGGLVMWTLLGMMPLARSE